MANENNVKYTIIINNEAKTVSFYTSESDEVVLSRFKDTPIILTDNLNNKVTMSKSKLKIFIENTLGVKFDENSKLVFDDKDKGVKKVSLYDAVKDYAENNEDDYKVKYSDDTIEILSVDRQR